MGGRSFLGQPRALLPEGLLHPNSLFFSSLFRFSLPLFIFSFLVRQDPVHTVASVYFLNLSSQGDDKVVG